MKMRWRVFEAIPTPGRFAAESIRRLRELDPALAQRLNERDEPITVHDIAAKVYGTDAPTRSQVESVRQIVKRLATEHFVALDYRKGKLTAIRRRVSECWCEECDEPFVARREDAMYCSNACRQRAYRRRQKEIADARAGRRAPIVVHGRVIGREAVLPG
jgi:hypothetical protein